MVVQTRKRKEAAQLSEHWSAWDESRGGPETDVENRALQLCRAFDLNGLQRVVLIRVAQFEERHGEPCWQTDSQIAATISDEIGRHPHAVSVRRARNYLERVGLFKCEQLQGNSTRLGPLPEDGIRNDREFAQAYGTTLKSIYWNAVPNLTRRSA